MTTNQKLKVNRTLGFEIEGFLSEGTRGLDLRNLAEQDWDGSLSYGNGDAVEIKSIPINDLNDVEAIYEILEHKGLNVNDTCGLHIHVDVSDFSIKDKAKLLRFGAGIELLMYALNERERFYGRGNRDADNGGEYSRKLHHSWRKIFRADLLPEAIPYDSFHDMDDLYEYINNNTEITGRCWNGKYQWLNADVGRYPTVEFRIFNATENYELAQKFGMLAYHIVETVKNSTVKQLSFIINSIYKGKSLDEMYERFFNSIGLDEEFRMQTQNADLADYIYNKYCTVNQETEEQAG
jgi:hypothetical protein